jgi:hypothetical protein
LGKGFYYLTLKRFGTDLKRISIDVRGRGEETYRNLMEGMAEYAPATPPGIVAR